MSDCIRLRSFFDDLLTENVLCAVCDKPVSEHENKPCPGGNRLSGRCPMCDRLAEDHVAAKAVMHLAAPAGKTLCEEQGPNEGRTELTENITCPRCILLLTERRTGTNEKLIAMIRELRTSTLAGTVNTERIAVRDALNAVFRDSEILDEEIACFVSVCVGEWIDRGYGGDPRLETLVVVVKP